MYPQVSIKVHGPLVFFFFLFFFQILFSSDVLDDNKPLVLTDAVLHSDNENHFVECLCTHVIESTPEQKEKHRSSFLTIIEWVTLTSVDKISWAVGRTRQLIGRKPFDYAAVDHEGLHIIIAAEALFNFVSDSLKPVIDTEEAENGDSTEIGPEYTWNQTQTVIHAQFTVPPNVTKADVSLATGYDKINLGLKNGKTLLEGQLFGRIDPNEWDVNLTGQRLELTLNKETEGMWPEIVVGNNKGEMTMDDELVKQIHDRLEHLTSDQWNPDPQSGLDKPYNAQQLEECDAFPEESAVLHRINGDTHKLTHQTNLGSHQWLFKASLDCNKVQSICLRHDVDGLMWQPENVVKEKELPWKHVSTFNAFGYVQASKQQRKFTTCSPDCSYAVICDCVRHVYIYRQPSAISSPLRNRKTGQQVDTVAKQQVIALESVDNIIGLQATNDRLFIATKQVLYSVIVNSSGV
ncbi:hypothetical protein KUTeg_011468 [Tegillarca granosa]|uniref:NudC domain-containing protein 1 n=1 Tax=Tegillarca granosa TaxID=220873 RepID=A0ABQ9F0Q8_TEGGR|nr:hypothetical protein KUTeg_011468 [Tegillarca granosa]